jgi:hypothetical protein
MMYKAIIILKVYSLVNYLFFEPIVVEICVMISSLGLHMFHLYDSNWATWVMKLK